MQWYIVINNRESGPMESAELLKLFVDGKVSLDTPVKRERSPLQRRLQDVLFELQAESSGTAALEQSITERSIPERSLLRTRRSGFSASKISHTENKGVLFESPEVPKSSALKPPPLKGIKKSFRISENKKTLIGAAKQKLLNHEIVLTSVASLPEVNQNLESVPAREVNQNLESFPAREVKQSVFDRAVAASIQSSELIVNSAPLPQIELKPKKVELVKKQSSPAHQKPRVASVAVMGEGVERIQWRSNRINTTSHHKVLFASDLNKRGVRRSRVSTRSKHKYFQIEFLILGVILVGLAFGYIVISRKFQRMREDLAAAEVYKQKSLAMLEQNAQDKLKRERLVKEQEIIKSRAQKFEQQQTKANAAISNRQTIIDFSSPQPGKNTATKERLRIDRNTNSPVSAKEKRKVQQGDELNNFKSQATVNSPPKSWPNPYLSKSDQLMKKTFQVVTVGPITVLSYPPPSCAPCEYTVRLRDGSTLLVVAGKYLQLRAHPGSVANIRYVKGFLQKRAGGNMALLLQAIYPN